MGFGQDFSDLNAGQDDIKIKGASTDTNIGNVSDSLKSNVTNAAGASAVNIQDGGNSITIDATALPLPTGAATAANQATEIASLASIDAGIPDALGQTTMAASMPVTMASNQSAIPISGTVTIVPVDGTKATYAACASGIVPAAATTDVFTITGSASKIIRITFITISCTTTAGSGFSANLTMVRRSTANTGGTSATITAGSQDTTNAAATAVVRSYTANPSALGTVNGVLRSHRFSISTAGGAGNIGPLNEWDFGARPAQAIVLRGTSDMLAINLGGVTITSPILSATVEWTEE